MFNQENASSTSMLDASMVSCENSLPQLSEKFYLDTMVAMSPSLALWRARPSSIGVFQWLEQFQISKRDINLAKKLLLMEGPLPYRMSHLREVVMQYGNEAGPFPHEPLEDVYYDDIRKCVVPVMSSPHVTTEHLPRSAQKKLDARVWTVAYYKPKANGEYAWYLTWSNSKNILVSSSHAQAVDRVVIGSSYERLPTGEYIPHNGDVIPGFASIATMEKHFGPQTECIVGIRMDKIIVEYKVKTVSTVELSVETGVIYDGDRSVWGTTNKSDGIYECVCDFSTRTCKIVQQRPDKEFPQITHVIRNIVTSMTYLEMDKYGVEDAIIYPTCLSIGSVDVDKDDVADWVVSDASEINGYARYQTLYQFNFRLSRYHFRRYGDRLVRTAGMAWDNIEEYLVPAMLGVTNYALLGGVGPSPAVIAYVPTSVSGIEIMEAIKADLPPAKVADYAEALVIEKREYDQQSTSFSRLLRFFLSKATINMDWAPNEAIYASILKLWFGQPVVPPLEGRYGNIQMILARHNGKRFVEPMSDWYASGTMCCDGIRRNHQLKETLRLGDTSFKFNLPKLAEYMHCSSDLAQWLASMPPEQIEGIGYCMHHAAYQRDILRTRRCSELYQRCREEEDSDYGVERYGIVSLSSSSVSVQDGTVKVNLSPEQRDRILRELGYDPAEYEIASVGPVRQARKGKKRKKVNVKT
jgi:hypothetical protein